MTRERTDLVRIEPSRGLGPCPHCFESSGYEARCVPDTWWEPGWAEPDPMRPCMECGGTGEVEMEDATDEELFAYFDDAADAFTEAESTALSGR